MPSKPTRLPGNVAHLQRLIAEHAEVQGMPAARLQRWLNAMVITAVLDRVRDENDEPVFLVPLQIPTPEAANCVSLRYQVAQKLHACTEVFETGRENDRFRDVMDVLLVEALIHEVGLAQVRAACVDIFAVRDKHPWPPTVTVYESWRIPFAALARENGFTPEDVGEPAVALTTLIAAIDAAVDQDATSQATRAAFRRQKLDELTQLSEELPGGNR